MLYLLATPIGNLEDISMRALRILRECDCIFAEDTRHSLALLRHFNIEKPLFACHQHNERDAAQKIAYRVANGEDVALLSDAGLPGISDPGAQVVSAMIEQKLPFTVIPGPCAATTALVLSGLPAESFSFIGFLPREKKERSKAIAALQREKRTMILYESPFRVGDTFKELSALLGDRPAALCRELTKIHEECVRGNLSELASLYENENPKGECVILIEADSQKSEQSESIEELLENMQSWIAQGQKPKQAAKLVSTETYSANALYKAYIEQQNQQQE